MVRGKQGMERKKRPLFVNDGSFMERFKQLQKEKEEKEKEDRMSSLASASSPVRGSSPTNSQRSPSCSAAPACPDDGEVVAFSCGRLTQEGAASSRNVQQPKGGGSAGGGSSGGSNVAGGGAIAFSLGKGGASTKGGGGANGKLAFSLKAKPKPVIKPIKLGGDDEDEEHQRSSRSEDRSDSKRPRTDSGTSNVGTPSNSSAGGAPPPQPPCDPDVQRVADKLASFVAKNGRQFENITRQKNPGDTPFRFLFDMSCADYKYYEWKLGQEEAALGADSQKPLSSSSAGGGGGGPRPSQPKESSQAPTRYQTPASALYAGDDPYMQPSSFHDALMASGAPSAGLIASMSASAGLTATEVDSVSMMEYFMKKAARQDLRKPSKYGEGGPSSTGKPGDPAGGNRGHHMGDFIPEEELQRFLARCNDVKAQAKAFEAAENAKIQADNVGHRLLSKMGWKEGMGLGSGGVGRSDPVEAGSVKLNNLGVGAQNPGEVTPEDDIYEQYKKRMMLGYRYRPNPLNNPRKAYY